MTRRTWSEEEGYVHPVDTTMEYPAPSGRLLWTAPAPTGRSLPGGHHHDDRFARFADGGRGR